LPRRIFGDRHDKESRNSSDKGAAAAKRPCSRRFNFATNFYDFSSSSSNHSSSTSSIDLNHRAGPAPMERAPRPSSFSTSFTGLGKVESQSHSWLSHLNRLPTRLFRPNFSETAEVSWFFHGRPNARINLGVRLES
jgi:hypothetical protein